MSFTVRELWPYCPPTMSFCMYFKSEFEEYQRHTMENAAKKLISFIDSSGKIQEDRIEYLYIWRWVFYKKIVDDCAEYINAYDKYLFEDDHNWLKFVKLVNQISFHSMDRKILSLSSLSVEIGYAAEKGINGSASAKFDRISDNQQAFYKFVEIVDECRRIFPKLNRTIVPYYIFVDEMEAYYGDREQFLRDLTLLRDLVFTIKEINACRKVKVIAALRNEIIHAMECFIPTKEINKVFEGYSISVKWSYTNSTSVNHPIIQILMKRISLATNGEDQLFENWFPARIHGKPTVSYILDNSWNKPRDIVRLLTAAQNDVINCNNTKFTVASFDALQKEYSNNSLTEIRQELQSLYTVDEIDMVIDLLRGGSRFFPAEELRRRAQDISSYAKKEKTLTFLDERFDDIIKDFYRVGLWGNVNRGVDYRDTWRWRWNHRGDNDVITSGGWELVIHLAVSNALSILPT